MQAEKRWDLWTAEVARRTFTLLLAGQRWTWGSPVLCQPGEEPGRFGEP